MANQLISDALKTTAKVQEGAFEYPVEREMLLADYDLPVFKIVKTCVEHKITQKYINANKLILEGFFRISVYYVPLGEGGITVAGKKIPFQKQFDLAGAVETPYFIDVKGEIQYVNTRAINPTRIDVRGVYSFEVRAYATGEKSVAAAIDSTAVCRDSETMEYFCLRGRGSRQFTAQQEANEVASAQKILNITPKSNNMTITLYQDKVSVKGDVSTVIAYTVKDSEDINKTVKTFAYNQVIDVEGAEENRAAYGDFSVISFTVSQNPQTRRTVCTMSAAIDVRVFKKEQIICITDAFSKEYEYTCQKKTAAYDKNLHRVYKNLTFDIEDRVSDGYAPVYHFVSAGAPSMFTRGEKSELKSKITVSLVAKNSQNEYECFTKSRDVFIDCGADISAENDYILSCRVSESDVNLSGDVMKARVNVTVNGFVIEKSPVSLLDSFEENSEKPAVKPPSGLILYYAQKGEKVFDIANRYKTDAAAISGENNLEGKSLTEDKMLFIPAFGL